jgi:hypothetical protein
MVDEKGPIVTSFAPGRAQGALSVETAIVLFVRKLQTASGYNHLQRKVIGAIAKKAPFLLPEYGNASWISREG